MGHGTPHHPTCKPHNCLILINHILSSTLGFLHSSVGKASICNAGDLGSIPGPGRSPWRRKLQPTAVFSPGESPGPRSLVGATVYGVAKSQTQFSSVFFFFFFPIYHFALSGFFSLLRQKALWFWRSSGPQTTPKVFHFRHSIQEMM